MYNLQRQIMSKLIYLKSENVYVPINSEAMREELEPGIYRIKLEEGKQNTLTPLDMPTVPEVIYGNIQNDISIVMSGYEHRKKAGKSTGVMLTGSFGVGKTLFCALIVHKCVEKGTHCYVLDEAIKAATLGPLLQLLPPGLIWIDEFDKVCPRADHQNEFLTILDGIYSTPSLFLFTSNTNLPAAEGLTNRPSRIFYRFDYITLEESVIDIYVKEKLKPELYNTLAQTIKDALSPMPVVTMDMLSCLVEEVNRTGLSGRVCINYMNINPKYFKRNWDGDNPVYLPRIYKLPEGKLCEIEENCANREIELGVNIRVNLLWLDPDTGDAKSFCEDITKNDFIEAQDKMLIYKLDGVYVVGLYPKPAGKLGIDFKEPTLTLEKGDVKTFYRHELTKEVTSVRDRQGPNARPMRPFTAF